MITRHQFLARLHHLLTPRSYLEVGVHTGESLRLASCDSIGIDPEPMVTHKPDRARVFTMTSDHFFTNEADQITNPLDLVFIDGMHLFEYALRDFIYAERHSNRKTVVVFDDVLPRNQGEAAREQCPGDWTGDVWKVHPILRDYRDDLDMCLVDTFPTGLLMVWGLDSKSQTLASAYNLIVGTEGLAQAPVPDEILERSDALTPDAAIRRLKDEFL